MPATKFSDEQIQAMYELALAGVSVAEIARKFGAGPSSLWSLLKRRYAFTPGRYALSTLVIPDDPAVLAYIAAIVDGEGSIKKDRTSWVVAVKMTHQGVIEWLHAFGGNYHIEHPSGDRKTIYVWVVNRHHDVVLLLKAITPYMRVLQDKALSVIQEID